MAQINERFLLVVESVFYFICLLHSKFKKSAKKINETWLWRIDYVKKPFAELDLFIPSVSLFWRRITRFLFVCLLGLSLAGLFLNLIKIQSALAGQLPATKLADLPTLGQVAKLIASDGVVGDEIGSSIAIRGNIVVIGAKYDDNFKGSAYVFLKPDSGWNGTLTQVAKLTASDGTTNDLFGASVAISGDTIAVGAGGDDNGKGSVYIFVKPSSGWATTASFNAKLTASDGESGDNFGNCVAISDDAIVVGAHADDSGKGAAYVFVNPGGWNGTLIETAKLTTSDGAVGDQFGISAAVSADEVIIGANNANSGQGAVYVFVKPSGGWATTSSFNAKLTTSDGIVGDQFGGSVAISSGTVVVGAIGDNSYKGATYIFVKPDGGWSGMLTEMAKLTASDGAVSDDFGSSVAISNDLVVATALGNDSFRGAAYTFLKPDSGWVTTNAFTSKLVRPDSTPNDSFGDSVVIDSYIILIGAPTDNNFKGSAYIFAPVSPVYLPLILR